MSPRLAFLALTLATGTALAACSTSSNSSNTTNPLAGVTIVAPPTASPTPLLTPTPTPAPMSTQAIADSGFESGGFTAGWTACSIPHINPTSSASPGPVAASPIGADVVSASSPPFAVASGSPDQTPEVHSGTYAAFTFSGTGAQTTAPYGGTGAAMAGNAGENGVCQTFTVPANAMLTMYVYEGGSDTGLKYADQQADIISGTTDTSLFFELNDPNNAGTGGATPGGSWVEKGPYALTGAPYNIAAGSSVMLFAGSYDSEPSAKYGVFMFVDDVTVTGSTASAATSVKRAKR